jgi:pimeloyl-ACP methyl ester carboxylesterase
MKKKIPFLLMGIFSFMHLVAQDSVPAFEYTDCFLEDCPPDDTRIQYAYLTVPEDYSQPEGRKLRLAVMMLKSLSENPQSDPIIYLRGGPGYTVFLKEMIDMFRTHPLRQNRDIILLEFRGIGLSEPSFAPEFQKKLVDLFFLDLTPEKATEIHVTSLEKTLRNLIDSGINLNMYNSAMVVKDLEMLRKALDIQHWNLWGISYGTRVAQTYLRDYPQAVRCAIMDSPVPMGYPNAGEEVKLYRNSLEKFFKACSENPGCNSAFPDLERRFYNTMETLKINPLEFSFENASEGVVYLNFQDMHLIIQQLLYEPKYYPLIPWLIKAVENRNTLIFKNLVEQLENNFYIYSDAMYVTVLKYDEGLLINKFKTNPDDPLHNALNHYENKDHMLRRMDFIIPDLREALPVVSEIPSLILAGSIDPVTPPAYAHILQKSLTESFLFEFPGRGHGVTRNTDCAKRIAFDFLNKPTVLPDGECIAALNVLPVQWEPIMYQNAHISILASHLLIQKNWIHITGIILLLMSF